MVTTQSKPTVLRNENMCAKHILAKSKDSNAQKNSVKWLCTSQKWILHSFQSFENAIQDERRRDNYQISIQFGPEEFWEALKGD